MYRESYTPGDSLKRRPKYIDNKIGEVGWKNRENSWKTTINLPYYDIG